MNAKSACVGPERAHKFLLARSLSVARGPEGQVCRVTSVGGLVYEFHLNPRKGILVWTQTQWVLLPTHQVGQTLTAFHWLSEGTTTVTVTRF